MASWRPVIPWCSTVRVCGGWSTNCGPAATGGRTHRGRERDRAGRTGQRRRPATRLGVDVGPRTYRLCRRDDAAPFGHSAGPQSWKQFLHPPRQRLWSSPDPMVPTPSRRPSPGTRSWGARACDLAAMGVLDRVLSGVRTGRLVCGQTREAFVVAVNCTEPGGLCFCSSMGTGPSCGAGHLRGIRPGADRTCRWGRRELPGRGRQPGRRRVAVGVADRPAAPADTAAAAEAVAAAADQMGRACRDGPAPTAGRLPRNHRTGPGRQLRVTWAATAPWSVPTCFCTSSSDVTASPVSTRALDGVGIVLRVGLHVRPRGPVRRSGPSRYRHWLTHKLSTWRYSVRQFGLRGLRAVHRLVPDRDRHHREMATFARLAEASDGPADGEMAPVPYRVRSKVVENAESVTCASSRPSPNCPRRAPASS